MTVSATEVCRALLDDRSPDSGWMRTGHGPIIEPRRELWLAEACMWVRSSGRLVTGWQGSRHYARWFGPVAAFRIRRAIRAWDRARPVAAP